MENATSASVLSTQPHFCEIHLGSAQTTIQAPVLLGVLFLSGVKT